MFTARPVDHFSNYSNNLMNPGRSHTGTNAQAYQSFFNQKHPLNQQQHNRLNDQDSGITQPPVTDNRRKRPLHFEPEFIAALDASLQENTRSRPTKKSRLSPSRISTPASPPLENLTPFISEPIVVTSPPPPRSRSASPPSSPSEGISIIDLSSGEELVPFHLGENEHKRRRESLSDSNSSDSFQEVFDVLDDGTLNPVTDHVPTQPSPIKRQRLHKNGQRLKVLEDDEHPSHSITQTRNFKRYPSTKRFDGSNYTKESNINQRKKYGDEINEDSLMKDVEALLTLDNSKKSPTSKAQLGALIRYEGPKSMRLAEGVDALIRQKWECRSIDPPTLDNAQGNELVLYRRPPPTYLSTEDDDYEPYQSSQNPRIQELTDEMSSDSSQNEDTSISELESKIMGMDID